MNKELINQFRNFRECAGYAPDGCYEDAHDLNNLLGDTIDNLMKELRKLGLKANNCDLAYELEARLYQYVKQSNPDNPMFAVSEGFGNALNSKARERVIAGAERDRDFIKSIIK